MAKIKHWTQGSSRPMTAAEMDLAAEALREFRRTGKQSLQDFRRKDSHGQIRMPLGKATEAARKAKLSKVMLYNARLLAQRYTAADLGQLIRRGRKGLFVLSVNHLIKLMTVQDGRTRRRLERQAIEGRWTLRRLKVAIYTVHRYRVPAAGRKGMVPTEPVEVEFILAQLWRRWQGVQKVLKDNAELRGSLAKEMQQALKRLAKVMSELGQALPAPPKPRLGVRPK